MNKNEYSQISKKLQEGGWVSFRTFFDYLDEARAIAKDHSDSFTGPLLRLFQPADISGAPGLATAQGFMAILRALFPTHTPPVEHDWGIAFHGERLRVKDDVFLKKSGRATTPQKILCRLLESLTITQASLPIHLHLFRLFGLNVEETFFSVDTKGCVWLLYRDNTAYNLISTFDLDRLYLRLLNQKDKKKMANTQGEVKKSALETGLEDGGEGLRRAVAKQFIKATRDPLVAALLRHEKDENMKTKMAELFKTPFGEAILASILSIGLSYLPTKVPGKDVLARELRVMAMAIMADVALDLFMGPLRQALSTAIQDPAWVESIKALEASTAQAAEFSVTDASVKESR